MKRFGFLFALLTGMLMSYTTSSSQEVGEDKSIDITSTAETFIDLLVRNDFSNAENYMADELKRPLPQEKLQEMWNTLISQAGSFRRKISTRTEDIGGGFNSVIVVCEFEKAALNIVVNFDQAKRVAGLLFRPAETAAFEYAPPSYVKPNTFHEKEVTVGSWALPGSLTLPVGQGPFPAVVLVQGSGPLDRDETIGGNKPFRDLGWGLASQGIAVLRYEKRTRHVRNIDAAVLTVKEETIDDVLAAVDLLRKTDGIDIERIFVLGHSLGGMLVPRIGKLDSKIAGFIVLAAAAKPIEDKILEQTTYIFSLDGTISAEEQARLEVLKKEVAKVKNVKPSEAKESPLLLGVPASYWLDLRGYDPVVMAKSLRQRILILQGERDYQVTMDDFQRWKSVLSTNKNVSFKSYPGLNHQFMEGTGQSEPSEYNVPGHVAEVIIDDIAQWIKK